jgi:hypothetical protein
MMRSAIRAVLRLVTPDDMSPGSRAERIVDSAMGPTQDTWVELLTATEHSLDLAKEENARLRGRVRELEGALARGLWQGLKALLRRG